MPPGGGEVRCFIQQRLLEKVESQRFILLFFVLTLASLFVIPRLYFLVGMADSRTVLLIKIESYRESFENAGQGHVFKFLDKLTTDQDLTTFLDGVSVFFHENSQIIII
jgi:hypothetical protein